MKELKSKKTGRVQIYSEEDYKIITGNPDILKRFIVTDLQMKSMPRKIEPPLEIKEIKKTKTKKHEG